jgi:hypothetical protein
MSGLNQRFTKPSGIHTVEVIFKETKLRVISDILSVVVGIGLMGST